MNEEEMLKSALNDAMEYIAELKLENAELKEKMKITSEWWVNRYYAVDKAKLQYRIDKAIEYMKYNATSNYYDEKANMFRSEIDLLNILQGSEENEN